MVRDKVRELEELNSFNADLRSQLHEVGRMVGEMEHRIDNVGSARSRRQSVTLPSRSRRSTSRTRPQSSASNDAREAKRRAEASRAEREKNLSLRWRGDFDWIGGRSRWQRPLDSARSNLTIDSLASDEFDLSKKRLSTPCKEWFKKVGHMTGSEQCRPGGLPKRMKREDFVEGQSTMLLVQGTKQQRAPCPGAHLDSTPRGGRADIRNKMNPSETFKCGFPIMDTPAPRTARTGYETNRSRADYHVKHPGLTTITKERPLRNWSNSEMVGQ